MKKIAMMASIAVLVLGTTSCVKQKETQTTFRTNEALEAVNVKVQTVQTRDVDQIQEFTATVEADVRALLSAERVALNYLQRNSRNSISLSIGESDDDGNMRIDLESDSYFDGAKAERQLQEAIAQLPPKQRQVFNMKYFQEMKYEDMSDILGTSIGALKASYHHAVQKVTSFFENND